MTINDTGAKNDGVLTRKVRQYEMTLKRLVEAAKEPGFTPADWAPLSEFVAVDEFERVGAWLEVMNWEQYTEFLTQWASAATPELTPRRSSELPGLVYNEFQERHTIGDKVIHINTLSVFQFNEEEKISHLDIYMQGQFDQSLLEQSDH